MIGDEEKQDQFVAVAFERYAVRLATIAAAHLDPQVRQKVDAEDVVLSTFRTLIRRGESIRWADEDSSVWGLLCKVVIRKCSRETRKYHCVKRSLQRERRTDLGALDAVFEIVTHEPTPEQGSIAVECVERVVQSVDQPTSEVFFLKLAGHSDDDIARNLQISTRTVGRRLGKVRRILQSLMDDISEL